MVNITFSWINLLQCNKTIDCPLWSNLLDLLNKISWYVSMFGINWTPLVLIVPQGNDILWRDYTTKVLDKPPWSYGDALSIICIGHVRHCFICHGILSVIVHQRYCLMTILGDYYEYMCLKQSAITEHFWEK